MSKITNEGTVASVERDHGGIAGHPRGLTTLFFTEFWERFSYYGMRALLILFMTDTARGGMALDTATAAAIYGFYTSAVYFMGIPGGWVADRLLGQRNAVLYGGILIAMGHYSMAIDSTVTFYTGLVLIVLGTGLLKPNVSSIVGQLYSADDHRRDAGFSIFYMGINMGAFFSPLVCGYLGQNVGWHWGFGAAGVGMTVGLIQYVLGGARLGNAGRLAERPKSAGRLWLAVVFAVLGLTATFYFLWGYRDFVLLVGTVAVFWWLLSQGKGSVEKKRIWSIIALFVFALLFWAGFEQAGSSLNLFADRHTQNSVFGLQFPSSFFQSVNPLAIIALAPVFAWLWVWLGAKEPSSPAKFMFGLIFLSLGFLIVSGAATVSAQGGGSRVSPLWLIAVYVLHTIGELCLSPVGLSTVTKLAPERLVGSMMGVWFLAAALGNFVGGRVAGLFERLPLPQLFGAVFITTGICALLLLFLIKPIRNLMGGIH
jgi:POT family proton-dependent oligopeptide transporter